MAPSECRCCLSAASRGAGSARTPAWFYILRLQSTNLYSGSTRSLEKRIQDHFAGKGCHTTRIDRPIALVYSEEHPTYKEAYRREQQVKRWTRAKKEALIAGDLDQLKKLAKRRTM